MVAAEGALLHPDAKIGGRFLSVLNIDTDSVVMISLDQDSA